VRPALIGFLQLRRRCIEIPVLRERGAPRVVGRRQIGGECDRVRVCLLRARPVAAAVEDVYFIMARSRIVRPVASFSASLMRNACTSAAGNGRLNRDP
jgi:hypothetical protein